MGNKYVLDACALVAYLKYEAGADIIRNILRDADVDGSAYMSKLNLFEVYYGFRRGHLPPENGHKKCTEPKRPRKNLA